MNCLLKVIDEKNMPFFILTGDQPVYTLIVQIRNENCDKFKKIIPILGPFHTQVAFITSLAKRYEGSGLSDLIVSASIIADKSIDQAMRGKHFRRIVRALQLVYEALQRQIIRHAMAKNVTLPKDLKLQLDTLKNENGDLSKSDLKDILRKIKENSSFNEFICKSYDIIAKTPMAEYWLSFMEMVEILVMNIHSLKTKNWIQFKQSIRLMIPWLQIYDKVHYGKWLPEFWSEMINLPHEIDVHMPSIFFSLHYRKVIFFNSN